MYAYVVIALGHFTNPNLTSEDIHEVGAKLLIFVEFLWPSCADSNGG
jgi:hypothetical protein